MLNPAKNPKLKDSILSTGTLSRGKRCFRGSKFEGAVALQLIGRFDAFSFILASEIDGALTAFISKFEWFDLI